MLLKRTASDFDSFLCRQLKSKLINTLVYVRKVLLTAVPASCLLRRCLANFMLIDSPNARPIASDATHGASFLTHAQGRRVPRAGMFEYDTTPAVPHC